MACKENTFVFHVLICTEKVKLPLLHSAKQCQGLPPPGVLLETINLCDNQLLLALHMQAHFASNLGDPPIAANDGLIPR